MLTAQWTHQLPFVQKAAPAELAAGLIRIFLDEFPDIDTERYFIIDFCSGAGGMHILFSVYLVILTNNRTDTFD